MDVEELENYTFINDSELDYIKDNVGIDPFKIMNGGDSPLTNNGIPTMGLNDLHSDNVGHLGTEDLKYIVEDDGFLKNYYPPEEATELSCSDYSGPHSFEVFVDPNGLKSPWEYSVIYNKVYIDIKKKFPVNFSIKSRPPNGLLFIRVTPVYEEDKYFHELVHRCICHEHPNDPSNQGVAPHVTQHIIRCDNSATQYNGDKVTQRRLNLVMPLSNPVTGSDSVKELLYFVCMTSCSGGGGMNRRPIQIIFTLENELGTVLGRRSMRVRVCACPKRDKEKEEKMKDKLLVVKGKKRKLDKKPPVSPPSDISEVANMVPLVTTAANLACDKNLKLIVEFCRTVMSDEILKLQNSGANPATEAPYRKCINDINAALNNE